MEENTGVDHEIAKTVPKNKKTAARKRQKKRSKHRHFLEKLSQLKALQENTRVGHEIKSETSKDEQKATANPRKRGNDQLIHQCRVLKRVKIEELQPVVRLDRIFAGDKEEERQQLELSQVRHLILHTVLNEEKSSSPKWVHLPHWSTVSKAVLVLLSGINEQLYEDSKECFPLISEHFGVHAPTKAAGWKTMVELPHITLLQGETKFSERQICRWRKMDKKVLQRPPGKEHHVLTRDEMLANSFPLPEDKEKLALEGYMSIQNCTDNKRLIEESPMFAIDCEMCDTSAGKEVTRVSVVDESLNVLYDTYVKPHREIINYPTRYSGITARLLEGVNTRLSDVQERLRNILPPDAILLGHSLENDLRALKLYHDRVIDTSVSYGNGNVFCKTALRKLAWRYLGKIIQQGDDGHSSIEDARTCMQLAQLKIEPGPDCGHDTSEVFLRQLEEKRVLGPNFGHDTSEVFLRQLDRKRVVASILDCPSVLKDFSSTGSHNVPCTSDEEVVSKIEKLMDISDFTWAQLHGAENALKEKYSVERPLRSADKAVKEALRTLDSHVGEIVRKAPINCLVVVVCGCADLTTVKKLQKQGPSSREELIEAVRQAKNGMCFMKRTWNPKLVLNEWNQWKKSTKVKSLWEETACPRDKTQDQCHSVKREKE